MPSVTLCKKFKNILIVSAQGLSKTQSTIIWLQGILRVKDGICVDVHRCYCSSLSILAHLELKIYFNDSKKFSF